MKKCAYFKFVKFTFFLVLSFIVMLAQLLRTFYSTIILFPVGANVREANRTLGPLFIDIFALSGSISLLILR